MILSQAFRLLLMSCPEMQAIGVTPTLHVTWNGHFQIGHVLRPPSKYQNTTKFKSNLNTR